MKDKIIPFGKHKGKPVEVLIADDKYRDWLTAQNWFRERFAELYAATIDYNKTSETPEHNQMQVMFLDGEYCKMLAYSVLPAFCKALIESHEENKILVQRFPNLDAKAVLVPLKCYDAKFEHLGADLEIEIEGYSSVESKEQDTRWPVGFKPNYLAIKDSRLFRSHVTYGSMQPCCLRVELKPCMGDDYPAVLRQMKSANCNVLVVRDYQGTGATWEQVVNIFKAGNIAAILESQIPTE